MRSKPGASSCRPRARVADGRAQALVSAGSTGAALAAALLHVKRLRGVYRPALAVAACPCRAGPCCCSTCGATLEVRPEQLVQFAFMGAAFSSAVLGVGRPRVGLLSVGEEPGKGTAGRGGRARALAALSGAPFEFAGNVEGGDIPGARSTWSSPTASPATSR